MSEEKNIPGVLSVINLTTEERETFIEYFMRQKAGLRTDFLFAVFGNNFLKFFDVFSGETVKVPRRDEVKKIIGYIKIYEYCKKNGFTEEAYEKASKVYRRRIPSVKRVVAKVERVLSLECPQDQSIEE